MFKKLISIYKREKEATQSWQNLTDEERKEVIERVERNFPKDQNEEIFNQTITIRNKRDE